MHKTIRMMTLAASLAAIAASCAHAQTIDGFNSAGATIYTLFVSPKVSTMPLQQNSLYVYDYLVTLKTASTAVNVNAFNFNFNPSALVSPVYNVKYNELSLVPGSFAFGAPTGLVKIGDTADFTFTSPLPPTGSVAIGTTSPGIAGGGVSSLGPGPIAVPEASPRALFALGLLPLALLARRRKASAV